jgi:PHS family inorganic phosphate transporter-like MFS transporter
MPGFFHVVVAGTGFLCDAYDLFVINIVLLILRKTEPSDSHGEAAVASAAVAGAVLGQVVFGAVADHIGRRKGFILTLSLVIVGALLSAAASRFATLSVSLFATLAICRFV